MPAQPQFPPRLPRGRFALAALVLFAGFGATAHVCAQFTERAAPAGVNLAYPLAAGGHSLPGLDAYAIGGAAAACDLDGDGWTDLIVARAGAPCLVFINNRDGTYREEAKARGLDTVSDIGGIAVGDLQNRGLPDVVMVPVAGPRQFLFVNDGTGHFTEVAAERGVDLQVTQELHLGQSVSLVDYDRDGYLDIYVSEWSVLSSGENARHNALLRNRGRAQPGFFENKTAAAGLVQPPVKNIIANYAAAWADFDGDGYPDLFIAGDFGTSQLWWNNGDGTFTDGTATSGIANPADGMGLAVLDYDGDGKLDLFVSAISLTNPSSTTDKGYLSDNKLFRYIGNRRFSELAVGTPVRESGWGWGVGSLDANNDGWPDLVVTNGYIGAGPNFAAGRTDPTKFFLNRAGTFSDETAAYRITDTGLGRSVVILDYDNDGREDVFLTQTGGPRLLYHNESPTNAHWLNLRLVGTTSNRDGYGCEVRVTAGGRTQLALYNPTNAYIGQREPRLHFGLGSATTVEKISLKWPSGATQELTNVAADRTLTVTETPVGVVAPTIATQPRSIAAAKDSPVTLTVMGQGSPAPVYLWFKDGVIVPGQNGPTLTLERVQPIDAGAYTVTLTNPYGIIASNVATISVTADLTTKTVARWWNEALLDGIRKDTPNPPVHARNLFHLSATLWDAYWAYEREGWAAHHEVFTRETVAIPLDESVRLAAQQQAMSFAAYTVLRQRFANSPGTAATLAGLRWLMQRYGYNPDDTDPASATPAAVGLRIGARVLALNLTDGANESGGYANATGFVPANPPLVVRFTGVGTGVDPNRWQPLDLLNTITQNGLVLGAAVQPFVGANAKTTRTFALARRADGLLADDPGPPPTLTAAERATYIAQAVEVLTYSSQLAGTDGATLDISPGILLNNPLGTNAGRGHTVNPVTGRAYPANRVNRGDYARVLAEFWADGPSSETPPGHWNLVFNQISDDPRTAHRFLGSGPALRRLEWDVCGYLALNAAMHDAACCAWTLKWQYNSARPITMIRTLAGRGQSSDPAQPRYSPEGLPLIPGQIELITAASSAPGQRHEFLSRFVGQIAVKAWLGTPPSAAPIAANPAAAPALVIAPTSVTTATGRTARLAVEVTGAGPITFEWLRGTAVVGTTRTLELANLTAASAGDYRVVVRNAAGSVTSAPARLAVRDAPALANLSIRATAGPAERALIAGFVVRGAGAKNVLVRGIGPGLTALGVANALPAPVLTVVGSSALALARNDRWDPTATPPGLFASLGAFPLATGSADTALQLALPPGSYTASLTDPANRTGAALVEIYEADSTSDRLVNLSARAFVSPGAGLAIAGFVVRGGQPGRYLIRGVGPALAQFGLTGTLADPVLTLTTADGTLLATNRGWSGNANSVDLAIAAAQLGAFPLATASRDAALLVTLAPGAYTAQLTGATDTSGLALLEVYEVP